MPPERADSEGATKTNQSPELRLLRGRPSLGATGRRARLVAAAAASTLRQRSMLAAARTTLRWCTGLAEGLDLAAPPFFLAV